MILNENTLADIGSFVETAGVRRGELLAHKEEGLRIGKFEQHAPRTSSVRVIYRVLNRVERD
jgi:hypothetical protein